MSEKPAEVVVIGAGLAGMTAAFHLSQRGYKVTVFEQDSYIGGQFRAVPVPGRPFFHEHCYHLFEPWYHNFFSLVSGLGLSDRFESRHGVKYLRRGQFPKMTELNDIGSWSSSLQNLFSGPLSIPDMYLFLYSYVDLLATPLQQDRYRDVISVDEFMHSRPYATERSTAMHSNVLLKAFGVPTFQSSAQSYRKFVEFGADKRSPMFYLMKGNVQDNFWQELENIFGKFQGEVQRNRQLNRIEVGDDGKVNRLHFSRVSLSPTLVDPKKIEVERLDEPYQVNGSVVLAVPPASLANLLKPAIYQRQPDWGKVLKLRTEPMASVHLHFNDKFVKRLKRYNITSLPREPVVLLDSRFSITFVDNSRTWKDIKEPYLHVIASDYRELSSLDHLNPDQYTYQGRASGVSESSDITDFNMTCPKSALDYIMAEVARYVPFDLDELDLGSLEIQSNMYYPIFINDIGSWPNRPTTKTAFPNLFMAGAHCQNAIDITTVEGAVLSGLEAAEAVRRRHGVGEPIEIIYPKRRPFYAYTPLQLLGAPYAMIAKVLSEIGDLRGKEINLSSLRQLAVTREFPTFIADLISAPYHVGTEFLAQFIRAFRR